MKKAYRYTVPGGSVVEAVGEWRTDIPESSYNNPVLELTLPEGERITMSKWEAESLYHVQEI